MAPFECRARRGCAWHEPWDADHAGLPPAQYCIDSEECCYSGEDFAMRPRSASSTAIPDPWGRRITVSAVSPRRRDIWAILTGRYKARVWIETADAPENRVYLPEGTYEREPVPWQDFIRWVGRG